MHKKNRQRPRDEDGVPHELHGALDALQSPDTVSPTFEQRVMDAVRGDHTVASARSLGIRSHVSDRRALAITLTPFRMVAAAASLCFVIAATAFISTSAARPMLRAGNAVAVRHDTTYVLRFVYVADGKSRQVQQVSLVGDFNGWTKGQTTLRPGEVPGVWTATVVLPAGRHEYAFVIHTENGDQWDIDPASTSSRDEFGTETSVVTVGSSLFHS